MPLFAHYVAALRVASVLIPFTQTQPFELAPENVRFKNISLPPLFTLNRIIYRPTDKSRAVTPAFPRRFFILKIIIPPRLFKKSAPQFSLTARKRGFTRARIFIVPPAAQNVHRVPHRLERSFYKFLFIHYIKLYLPRALTLSSSFPIILSTFKFKQLHSETI